MAKATVWLTGFVEGQRLLAVPALRVEQEAAMRIASGTGLGDIFRQCAVATSKWHEPAGFVGGSWMLWRLGKSELHEVGFVVGQPTFDIERAVRGLRKLLR